MRSTFMGKVLRINLSNGEISEEQLDSKVLRMFVGGSGVGIKILYDEVAPDVGPFDPENRLIFATGPFNGTRIPGSGIYSVVTKGALNNLLASAQANGYFGARLRQAGYDFIVIQGVSPEWKYIWIHDGKVELRSAEHLLGLDTWETEKRIKEELGLKKASVACIGPAGENLVKFAAICSDHGHVAATNGPGAVMGSKKIKAVAVFSEKTSVGVWDPEQVQALRRSFVENIEGTPPGASYKNLGTFGSFEANYKIGGLAIKNYTTSVWPSIEKYFGGNIRTLYERKREPCRGCSWNHCSSIKVTKGEAAGYVGEEPEFEQLSAWTHNIGNDDIVKGIQLSNLTDGMGLDCKECTFAISMCIELFEKGVIGLKETGGLELRWGNTDAVDKLIQDIAHRRGFGDLLADGVKAAAEKIGGEALNCAVYTGMGLAPHVVDGRQSWPHFIFLSFSETGSFYGLVRKDPDIGNMDPIDPFDVEQIANAHANTTKRWVLNDALGVCFFWISGGRLGPVVDMLNAVTGWDFTIEESLKVGERIKALSKAFNIRNGLSAEKVNAFSTRYGSAAVDGPNPGRSMAPYHALMARIYYKASGWDEKTSKPLPKTLQRLGLDYIVKDLW